MPLLLTSRSKILHSGWIRHTARKQQQKQQQ
jgi:hypothetical protein